MSGGRRACMGVERMKRTLLVAVACALFVLAGNAGACRTDPPIVTPTLREATESADIVAVIHVDGVEWRTPEEEAEFRRLWERPPMNTPFSYPARSARFSVKRVLKGSIPANTLIWSGATSCDVDLAEGRDYVLFASLPSGEDDRLMPLRGTFPLDAPPYTDAMLAEVESFLTHSNAPTP